MPTILYAADALLVIMALLVGHDAVPGNRTTAPWPGWLSRSLPLVPLIVAALVVSRAQPAVVMAAPVLITGLVLVVALLLRQMLEADELASREREIRALADRLTEELDSAANYVSSILPGDLAGPVQVRSRYLPSLALGGDTFGYFWVDDDYLVVYLIDVSGHGMEPALLSVSVHNLLRSRPFPTATLLSPARVLAELNERFRMENHDDHYFTMWFGVFQASTRLLRYAEGGHPPALALTRDGDVVEAIALATDDGPIGMFPDADFDTRAYRVPDEAQILLYSDGVLSDRLPLDEFVTSCEELAADPDWSLDTLIDRSRESAGGVFDDDCALVLLSFPGCEGSGCEAESEAPR